MFKTPVQAQAYYLIIVGASPVGALNSVLEMTWTLYQSGLEMEVKFGFPNCMALGAWQTRALLIIGHVVDLRSSKPKAHFYTFV